jgi:hypothetical protein
VKILRDGAWIVGTLKRKCKKSCNNLREAGNLARYLEAIGGQERGGGRSIKEDEGAG